ncbi:hypothetical protein GCM10020229_14920 [Kitasatospora albolonga]
MSIYFCTKSDAKTSAQCSAGAATDQQIAEVKGQLDKMTQLVQSSTFESSQDAYKRWKETNPDNPLLAAVGAEAMPQSWRVKLNDPTKYDVVQSAFAGKPGVKSVEDQRKILENLFGLLNGLQTAAFVIMVLMLFVALLLIVNTVRVSAFSRRRETGIMRLVGASNFYVQMPFIAEAAFAALLGAVLASGCCSAGTSSCRSSWPSGCSSSTSSGSPRCSPSSRCWSWSAWGWPASRRSSPSGST